MILADTSIWVDHFRHGNELMRELLMKESIICHPFVIGELAMGSMQRRKETLAFLDCLPQVRSAFPGEVREMIEARSLHSQGIGLIDAHLLASVLIDPPVLLWTADKRLRQVAADLGVHVDFPEKEYF